ncbi:MAG: cadmium-translocating P-type ATPase [Gammaproteobacteria bacterium]|nr:cadmium-translocating P-type ATPase [Gammaproteobacteria bacterium]
MEEKENKKLELILYIVGALFFIAGILFKYVFNNLSISVILEYVLFSISFILIGHDVILDMIEEFKEGNIFNEGLLMVIASIAAIVIREEIEAHVLIVLSIIGEIIEDYARDKTEENIEETLNLKVDTVRLETGELKRVEDIVIGDIFSVKVGEVIPVEGIVINGESDLDTKRMTGEAMPLAVSKNDKVLSGTINLSGVLIIEATTTYENSSSKKLLDLVKEAKEKKSKAESFIEKFSKFYTPIVILIAISLFFIQYYLVKLDFNQALIYSATILVSACPCAIIISIPLSFYTGIGRASKEGILVRGSEYLESFSNVGTIVFDKTGTLTEGEFKIENIEYINIDEILAQKLLVTIESYSNHPVARAFKEQFENRIVNDKDFITNIKEVPGLGMEALYHSHKVLVGGLNTLKKLGLSVNKECSNTSVFLIIDNEIKAIVTLKDILKDSSPRVISYLKKNKSLVYMLTGDKEKEASVVKEELGLDGFKANCLPEEKIKYLNEYISEKGDKTLAYIGDGINDAPSLKLADIGIAMGKESSEAAKEASDIVILNDDIIKVKELHQISKFTHKIAFIDVLFALFIKASVIVLISLNLLSFLGSYVFIVGLLSDTGLALVCILISRIISKYKIKD